MRFLKKAFKGIGKTFKKINLRGALRTVSQVAGMAGVPLLSGVIDSQMAKREEEKAMREAEQQAQAELAQSTAYQDLSNTHKLEAIQNLASANLNKATIKDIANAALGGALTGAGGAIAGTNTVGDVGAKVVDSTISAWFKKHWLKLVGGIVALVVLVKFVFKRPTNGRRR